MKNLVCALVALLALSACAPDDYGESGGTSGGPVESGFQRNPKQAVVEIDGEVVTISIPGADPHFWIENVNDDTVEYSQIFFKYEPGEARFYFRTDLEDWQPVPAGEDTVDMGQVRVTIDGRQLTVVYPSGTWAFP